MNNNENAVGNDYMVNGFCTAEVSQTENCSEHKFSYITWNNCEFRNSMTNKCMRPDKVSKKISKIDTFDAMDRVIELNDIGAYKAVKKE